ncbi:rab-GTPase-TBC domain-containing protein [Schizophyllum commune]
MPWEKAPERRNARGPQAWGQRDGQQRSGQRQGQRTGRQDSRPQQQQQRRRRRDEDEDEGDMAVPKLGGQAAVAKVESSTVADIQYLLTLSPGLADTIKNVPELAPAVQQALTARTAPTKPKPDTFRVAMNGAVFDLPLDSTTEGTVAALRKQYQSAMRVISPRSPRIIGFTVDDIPEEKQAACQATLLELAERAPAEAFAAAEEAARFDLAQSVRLRDEHALPPPKFVQKLREGYVNEDALDEYIEGAAWPQERDENKRNWPDVDFLDLDKLLDAPEGLGEAEGKAGKVRDRTATEVAAPPSEHTLEARGYGRFSPVAQAPNVAAIALAGAGARRSVPPKQKQGVVETAKATLAKRPEVTLSQRNTAEAILQRRQYVDHEAPGNTWCSLRGVPRPYREALLETVRIVCPNIRRVPTHDICCLHLEGIHTTLWDLYYGGPDLRTLFLLPVTTSPMESPTLRATVLAHDVARLNIDIDIDDAFEDADESHTFSPEALRKDLDAHRTWVAADINNGLEQEGVFTNGAPIQDDASVSTLELSASSSPSPDESSAHFSQISLSSSKSAPSQEEEVHEESAHEYPNVQIDVPTHQVTMSGGSNGSRESAGSHSPSTSDAGGDLPPLPTIKSDHTPKSSISSMPPTTPTASTSVPAVAAAAAAATAGPSTLPHSTSVPTRSPEPNTSTPHKLLKAGHRQTKSTGPSTFEKVRSRTRPAFLPPKPRQEDDKHLADWQAMMRLSRQAAEKRRKALQERRLARERAIEDSLHRWEKEILPDWRVVHRDPALRKLWWKGIPTKLRARMWQAAVGNALALSSDSYNPCIARARRALSSGTFPQSTLAAIEADLATTLPSLHIFHHETGPLYGELKELLCAWVVARSDEGLGYTKGASRLAAMLLITMPAQQAFVVMRNLLERHCMRSFYGGEGAKDDVEAYYRIFDTLLADGMPKIYFNFKQHQISPASYLPDWLIPLFLDHLPFEACARLWDVILLEGDPFLFRAALGMLAVLEPRLFFPDKKELLELLKGENKAAIDIARRDGLPLDGGKYEIYGVDEETLWERIDSMEDWWKESTWKRLTQRELPDI